MKITQLLILAAVFFISACKSDAPENAATANTTNTETQTTETTTTNTPNTSNTLDATELEKTNKTSSSSLNPDDNTERAAALANEHAEDDTKLSGLTKKKQVLSAADAERLKANRLAADNAPQTHSASDLNIVGTYTYDKGSAGSGSLVITQGPANRFDYVYKVQNSAGKNAGSMEGFFVLLGNTARSGSVGKSGTKCELLFTFTGDKITTSLKTGDAADCGGFSAGATPNAIFTKAK